MRQMNSLGFLLVAFDYQSWFNKTEMATVDFSQNNSQFLAMGFSQNNSHSSKQWAFCKTPKFGIEISDQAKTI
jgi:hypothetical protein